jgi:hypothetical protein
LPSVLISIDVAATIFPGGMTMFLLCAALLGFSPSFTQAQASASPDKVYLDCNASIGPDQQFKVERRNGQLVLKELTMKGSWIERVMSDDEISKGPIVLTEALGNTTHVWFTPHGTWIESKSADGSYRETAEADCTK